jgi:putative transposase
MKPEERIVLAVLQRLRPVWERTSSLVTPDTLRRWHRELIRRKWTQPHRVNPKRAVSQQTQLLVWRLSKENPLWGYQRIQGELLKLGIEISASSIRRVIAPKRRPGPKRDTWSKFMRAQAASIIACDLFTVETVRLKTLHVLFFIDLHTRRVLIGGVTDGATNVKWCTQIARNLSEERESRSTPLRFLVHDRDHRFGEPFDEVLKAEGVEIIRTPWRAPRANAYAERFVRTVRAECLDRIFVLSERHLESVLKTYVNHYNRERPHRGLDLRIPRVDRHSTSKEPLDRSCAATASVALSTNTTGRPLKSFPRVPPLRYSTLRQSGVQGSIEARLAFFGSPRRSHSHISSKYS